MESQQAGGLPKAFRLLSVACIFLVLLTCFVQVLHWHKESVGGRDCATCVIGHSPSAPPPAHNTHVHAPAVTPITVGVVSVRPFLVVRDFSIRPPPKLSL
jgi:hypothetical protein